jgi:hypothetical protein
MRAPKKRNISPLCISIYFNFQAMKQQNSLLSLLILSDVNSLGLWLLLLRLGERHFKNSILEGCFDLVLSDPVRNYT